MPLTEDTFWISALIRCAQGHRQAAAYEDILEMPGSTVGFVSHAEARTSGLVCMSGFFLCARDWVSAFAAVRSTGVPGSEGSPCRHAGSARSP